MERDYTGEEGAALGDAAPTLGQTTFNVYLSDRAYWHNVPTPVWSYNLSGH